MGWGLVAVAGVLVEMMDAVNAGDAARYARLYAQDAVITIHGSGELRGRAAIQAHEVELLREFPDVRLAFYDVWQSGPLAAVHYAVNGRTPAGQAMGHEGLLFYRFQASGLIEDERRYMDSLTPMAQLGLLGALPRRPLPTLPSGMKSGAAKGSRDEDDNLGVVRACLSALGSRDEAAFLAGLTDDVVVDELILPQPFEGKAGAKAWFETWSRAAPEASSEIVSLLGVGEHVLAEAVVRGTLKGRFGLLSPSPRPFAVHRAALCQLRNGKLSRISIFMNGKELAEAVGQWPPPATQ